MSDQLAGRRVLITGGARGLGAGMATAMAAAGASVMIADVLKDVGEQTAAEHLDRAARAFVELDVTDDAQWEAAVAHTVTALGGLDVVVNNAGIEVTSLLVDTEPDDVRRDARDEPAGHDARAQARLPRDAPGRRGRARRVGHQHGVGGGDHRLPGDRGLLGHEVRRRPAHPRRRDGVGQARLRRARQLPLPRPGAHRHGREARRRDLRARACSRARTPPSARSSSSPRPGASAEVSDIADAAVFLASDASRFVNGVGLPVDGGMGM